MNRREILSQVNQEILFADGFDDAILGYITIFDKCVVVYDRKKCVDVLMQRDKISLDEAEQFMSFNVEGAFVGEHTPAFLTRIEDVRI